jgi:microcystin-dependent protein
MGAQAPTRPGLTASLPTGVVLAYCGENAPEGWLMCFGQSVSKATYAGLWALCGEKYGAATSTNFVLPDIRGRTIAGQDDMGGVAASRLTAASMTSAEIGGTGGNELSSSLNEVSSGSGGGFVFQNAADAIRTQPTIVLNYIIKT